ncbi:MAG: hypothetical protein DRP80_06055 [Candidatus Omnitrophota bacterium]|nr:MAG: hypothetical protein DRP80_06055 [Candidatus Omnitrophota bacterium]
MEKVKVAQVITRMDWAGSTDIVRILTENLDKNKYEIKLIIGKSKNLTPKNKRFLECFRDNVIVVPFLRREINLLLDLLSFFSLYLIFKREKFAIIHTHTSKAGFLGRISGKLAGGSKIVYMPHGHIFYGYFNSFISNFFIFLEKLAGFFTDEIIALTNLEKNDFLSLKIMPEEKIAVVPSGIEIKEILEVKNKSSPALKEKLGFRLEDKLVGMTSRLEPVKGGIYFIEAIPLVLKRFADVKFLIVGEGSQKKFLMRRARELDIEEDRVLFLGWRKDVLEIISILDILVQPSLNEAVGRSLLEAQLMGVPIVATSVGGIPEVVQNKRTGLLVKPKDSQALARAIIELLEDDEKRKSYFQAGQNWVKENFSSQKMVEKIDRIYKSLLSNESS